MGQRAQGIPLVADLLAPRIDIVGVVVIQLTVGQADSGETQQQAIKALLRPQAPQVSQDAPVPRRINI